MRVAHVTAQRPDSTGSGVYLAETVRALGALGHEQLVVAGVGARDESPFSPEVRFVPVRFETPELPFPVAGMSDVMPYAATRYRDFTSQMTTQYKAAFGRAFDEAFGSFAPDIVICHHLYLACGVLMNWMARHPDVRRACSVRAVSHNTDIRQFCSHGLERDFIAQGVRGLDYACALHDAQAREIVRVYGLDPARVRVTGTGFNGSVFNPGDRLSARQVQDGTVRLVYVGKLWKQKGLMQLFDALDLVAERLSADLSLTMVGGYSDEAERDQIVARAGTCKVPVRFLGQVGQEELADAYRCSDVFVLPSFSEGLPLVAVEALACGCKVVMTDLPGVGAWFSRYAAGAPIRYVPLPRLRQEGGAVAPEPGDEDRFVQDLAQAIERSVQDPCRPADLTALSWEALAKRLII